MVDREHRGGHEPGDGKSLVIQSSDYSTVVEHWAHDLEIESSNPARSLYASNAIVPIF